MTHTGGAVQSELKYEITTLCQVDQKRYRARPETVWLMPKIKTGKSDENPKETAKAKWRVS